jgi:hypothetical protein
VGLIVGFVKGMVAFRGAGCVLGFLGPATIGLLVLAGGVIDLAVSRRQPTGTG